MTDPIVLPPLGSPVDEVWEVLPDLSERLNVPWSLIGGQMVLLHALEHHAMPPQVSQDGDVIADIRAAPGSLGQVVAELEALGFTLEGIDADGVAHRYSRPSRRPVRPVIIDVLATREAAGVAADAAHLELTGADARPGHTVKVAHNDTTLGALVGVASAPLAGGRLDLMAELRAVLISDDRAARDEARRHGLAARSTVAIVAALLAVTPQPPLSAATADDYLDVPPPPLSARLEPSRAPSPH